METKEEKTIEQRIAEQKEAYDDVYRAEVDSHAAYLKKPTRRTLGAAAVTGKTDSIKCNEILSNNCWIEGDEMIKKDGALFLGISAQPVEIIEAKKATLKRL